MADEQTPTQRAEELKEIQESLSLLRSSEWKTYVAFLKKRAIRLQNDVNKAVEEGNLAKAQACLAVLKDSQEQARVFSQQTNGRQSNIKPEERNG